MQTEQSNVLQKFNRYHQSATFHKVQLNDAYFRWFQSKVDNDEWRLFTCTVVFNPIDNNNTKHRFEDEYKKRFLNKIRRRLTTNARDQLSAIPFEECYYYERFEKSRLKVAGKCNPPHIHSIIPVRTEQVHRFWSYDNNRLHPRLFKDLHSIDIVQDVLIEPVWDIGSFGWLMYVTKEKEV